jgi:hypothetical protein
VRYGVVWTAILLSLPAIVFCQTAQLSGLIQDQHQGAVAGADVTVTNEQTGVKRATASNGLGVYTVAYLQPGSYDVKV